MSKPTVRCPVLSLEIHEPLPAGVQEALPTPEPQPEVIPALSVPLAISGSLPASSAPAQDQQADATIPDPQTVQRLNPLCLNEVLP